MFGEDLAFPIFLAPTAFQRTLHPEGELAMARGATKAGALFVVSSSTTTRVEDIAASHPGPRWFQLYVQSDRDVDGEE